MTISAYLKDGRLSRYSLSCGCTERTEKEGDDAPPGAAMASVQLWKEHGCYHVRAIFQPSDASPMRRRWLATSKLTTARRLYRAMASALQRREGPTTCSLPAGLVSPSGNCYT